MEFGPVRLEEADGAILAHSVALKDGRLRKGLVLGAKDLERLAQAGISEVTVARLGPDDMHEDEAALAVAEAILSETMAPGLHLKSVGTGRVNLYASIAGVTEVRVDLVNALNAVDPMITLATVRPWQRVPAGEMVATVKIISYGVSRQAVSEAVRQGSGAIFVHRPVLGRAVLIETETGEDGDEKGYRSIQSRLRSLGVALAPKRCVAHRQADLAEALKDCPDADLILILTASATSDVNDVAPNALRQAGGRVDRFGMPVDPGNLLFLGQLGRVPVIGLPGCAKSPALNGADWVMERVICGVPVTSADIAAMGAGGLLKEVSTRGRPRDPVQA